MFSGKLYLVMAMLGIIALVAGACTSQPGPLPSEVRDAAEARGVALSYLLAHVGDKAPSPGADWQAQDVTPPGLVGSTTIEFTSGEWRIKVSYPVVPPENTVYQVVVSSVKLGWHWEGTVEYDGTVTEVSPFKQISEEDSQTIAEEFLRNSPTFAFDGIEGSLRLVETLYPDIEYAWSFIFTFESRHAGYGDRAGQIVAQVITPHEATITVEYGEVKSALMDEKWNMIEQKFIDGQGESPEGTMSVAELLANPVYDTEVRIYGEVSLLGELFCPCFELTSGGQKVQVWYDLMVENDGTERPAVSVQGINNGDRVIVTGELKGDGGTHYSKDDFWATVIIVRY